MKTNLLRNLVIFEMANNHMGSVEHGINIIKAFAKICKGLPFQFAFKFQYRDLDTFIHSSYKNDFSFKYIKRFQETRLSPDQFAELRAAARAHGFLLACTPFDEVSVERIVREKYDILKIASCSLGDWPLVEKIAGASLPVIFSTAGASAEAIERTVLFFKHRCKDFAMLHCIGEYPAAPEHMSLDQFDYLKANFAGVSLGYSGHEDPADTTAAMLAVAKGATIFERHVGLATDQYALNAYSSSPEQARVWLESIVRAQTLCGGFSGFRPSSAKEQNDLHGLRRGCYLVRAKMAGEPLLPDDLAYCLPNLEGHLTACDLSKYARITLGESLPAGAPVLRKQVTIVDHQADIQDAVKDIFRILRDNKIHLPHLLNFEFSHHYGFRRFREVGASIINCINREYCKKIIVIFPGQRHPMHFHKQKEETFQVLHGKFVLDMGEGEREYQPGDIIVVERGQRHAFRSDTGAIFEEVSTTHIPGDSFYDDQAIMDNPDRKTTMSFWANDYPREFYGQ